MSRTLLLLAVVGCACTAFAATPDQGGNGGQSSLSNVPAGKEPTAEELSALLRPHAPTAEELAADELDPAFAAKKDGKLILSQLAARAKPVIEGMAPNYTVYRGMKVGMTLKADMLVVQVAPETTNEAAVLEASKLGLRIKEASRTGAGDFVMLTLVDTIKDLETAAAWVKALAASPTVKFAAPVFVTPLSDEGICFPTSEMRVRVDTAVLGSGAMAAKMSTLPLAVVDDKLGTISGGALLKITGKNGFDSMRAANDLAAMRDFGILYAECDMMQTLALYDIIPNDPEFVNQWQHRNTGQYGGWASGVDMRTPAAWELALGAGVRIAVLDTGVQQGHPDINGVAGADFTTGAVNGVGNGGPVNFCEKHGTPCASIISSFFNNGSGGAGVAPSAVTVSCRIGAQNQAPASCSNSFTSSSSTWLVNAMAWSHNQGHKATSNSYGGYLPSQALDDQISNNYNNGTATFVSTGNDGAGNIGYPSSSPSAIAIGAMDPSGVIAGFSNRGNGISMVAPGVNVRAGDRTGGDGYDAGDITWFGGTSAACPAAAGVAALVVSAHPHLTSAGLKFFMQAFCRDFGAAGYDTTYGFGMPNALGSINGFAPDNDECGNARAFSGLSYSNSANSFNATNRSAEPDENCGSATNTCSVYWRYTSTAYGTATINTNGSDYDTVLSVFNGCGFSINLGSGPIYIGPTQLACDDDSGDGAQSALTVAMNPGSDYVIKVAKYGTFYPVGGNANLNFSFAPSPPPNDSFFFGSILLSAAGQAVTGTTNYATNDSGTLPTCGGSDGSPDVWYYFTPTCNANYTVSTYNNSFDTVLTVYTGNIFNRQLVGCNDDCNPPERQSCLSFDVLAGQSYYIRVAGYNGLAGVFNLNLSGPSVPNDTCAGAVALTAGTTATPTSYTFDNGCATDSTGLPVSACGAATTIYKDIWYSLNLAATSDVTIDTFTSTFDTVIAVYDSCPAVGALPLICNDDFGVLQSQLSFQAVAGTTYFVRVGSYDTASSGAGTIHVAATEVVVPPTCLADVNTDGIVDGDDFIAFINSFGVGDVAVDPIADVNLDSIIDGSDFIEFINAFGAGC